MKLENVAASLIKGGFTAEQTAEIMKVLQRDNLVQASAGGFRRLRTPEEIANDSQNHAQLRQIMAMCRRWEVTLDPVKLVDTVKLDADLSAAKASVESRLQIKTAMAQIGLIQ